MASRIQLFCYGNFYFIIMFDKVQVYRYRYGTRAMQYVLLRICRRKNITNKNVSLEYWGESLASRSLGYCSNVRDNQAQGRITCIYVDMNSAILYSL